MDDDQVYLHGVWPQSLPQGNQGFITLAAFHLLSHHDHQIHILVRFFPGQRAEQDDPASILVGLQESLTKSLEQQRCWLTWYQITHHTTHRYPEKSLPLLIQVFQKLIGSISKCLLSLHLQMASLAQC
jgi:hypothetical protein